MSARVIGVGHPDRGDDAAGLAVLSLLRGTDLDCVAAAADGPGLLAQLEKQEHAIIVDSARGGGAVGKILRVAGGALAPHRGTHGNALAEALALGAALDCLPSRLSVFAVVGERFGLGEPMSDPVRAALPALAAMVREEAACTKPT